MDFDLTPPGQQKRCSRCRVEKPVGDFSRDRTARDGLEHDCRVCTRARVRRWMQGHPVAVVARRVVRVAIARGELLPAPCEVCDALDVDAHHDDYTRPLEVHWLCRRCHRRLHPREAARAALAAAGQLELEVA